MELVQEIDRIASLISRGLRGRSLDEFEKAAMRLRSLAEQRLVKSNHTIMELIVAAHLAAKGYRLEVEYSLDENLVCDIFAVKDNNTLIVEVETGFVPPENSLDPVLYRAIREISKVSRYSRYSDYFGMATPPYHLLQLPVMLFFPPSMRSKRSIYMLKRILDNYYTRPPVGVEDILKAKLNYVYIAIVDELAVIEYTAKEYYRIFLEGLRQSLENALREKPLSLLYANHIA